VPLLVSGSGSSSPQAIEASAPPYLARSSAEPLESLLDARPEAWESAEPIAWGPDAAATRFRALWSDVGLAVRFDVTDPAPWHTLTAFDERLWTEEVVELFLDVGATGRAYAELEWNPAGVAVDLWCEGRGRPCDRSWNADGLKSRVEPRRDAAGRATGWTVTALVPWDALREKAPPGTALPPRAGDRWRFNVLRIERPHGPSQPEKDALKLAWSPTGEPTFHVPQAFREIEFAPVGGVARACHEESREAMGSTASVRACGPEPAELRAAVDEALSEVDRLDRLLSHYRGDSPLSRLNREAASGPVVVPPELADVLATSLRWSRDSDGAFDVTVGPLMKAWGFFRDEGRVPEPGALARAREAVGFRHVVLDREAGSVRFDRPGVELDLGGIGKGYAVDRVVALLRRRGVVSALVNLGGSSVYGLGAPPGAVGWEVALQDPSDPSRVARRVPLRDRALSVSGALGRRFEQDGVTYTHVMDPRSGRPVAGVLGVAVLSASATDGDALDNALFVQGLEQARAFVARLPPALGIGVYYFLPQAGTTWRMECFGATSCG
jgi:thiamine biosynthesis lipoprotein